MENLFFAVEKKQQPKSNEANHYEKLASKEVASNPAAKLKDANRREARCLDFQTRGNGGRISRWRGRGSSSVWGELVVEEDSVSLTQGKTRK